MDNEITLTAVVSDQETPIDQLKFVLTANAGTFTGDGAVVQWRAPKGIKTPAHVDIKLTVTETYGSPDASGVRPQNVATSSVPAIRVQIRRRSWGTFLFSFFPTSRIRRFPPARACATSATPVAAKQTNAAISRPIVFTSIS